MRSHSQAVPLGVFARNVRRHTVEETFAVMAALRLPLAQFNYSLLGLPSLPDRLQVQDCVRVADAAAAGPVEIWGVSATFNAVHPDVDRRARETRLAQRIVETAPLLGSPVVTLCTGSRHADDKWAFHPDNERPDAWADLLVTLRQLLDSAEACDVVLGVEPEAANVVANARKAAQLMEEAGSTHVGVILDVANLVDPAEPAGQARVVDEAVECLASSLLCVHAKDVDGSGAAVAPGQGVIDFAYLARRLEVAGVRPPVIIQDCPEPELPDARRHLVEVGLV